MEIQKGLNFDLKHILACLISHEHMDHCKAAKDVMDAGIDTYMSTGTAKALGVYGKHYRLCLMSAGIRNWIQGFVIYPFDIQHDAQEPLGFLIQYKPTGEKLLYLTDSFYSKYRFVGLNYILIECNYIKETLDANIEAGLIDEAQKLRLLKSHFSLEHVKQFLKANDLSECRKIILLHLSNSNSDAARMVQEIQELTGIDTVAAEAGQIISLELFPY